MLRWYRSLIPGRMPLPLAWFVSFFGVAVLLIWTASTFGGGIVIRLQAGDTIRFEQVRQSADSTEAHFFTVQELDVDGDGALDVDVNLDDGRFGSDPPGGALDAYEITFPEPGQFVINDSAHPRSHGRARFVVAEGDRGGRLIVTGAFVVDDDRFELSTSATETQFGYAPGSVVPSRSLVDQVLFLSLIGGSLFAAPLVAWTKRRRWWLWGIFGFVGGFLGVSQPFLTSATVAAAVVLAERVRPVPVELEDGEATEAEAGAPATGPAGPPTEAPSAPPTQDQRTLPPPAPATPPRPRPQRGRRRPRY